MTRRNFFSRIAKAALSAVAAPVILREVLRAEMPVVGVWEPYSTRIGFPVLSLYDFIMADDKAKYLEQFRR